MLEIKKEIWQELDAANIAKAIILYIAKYKKKLNVVHISVEGTFAILKNNEKNYLNFEQLVYKEKSYFIEILNIEHSGLKDKINGMLVFDNIRKKVVISGLYKKKITEKFEKDI